MASSSDGSVAGILAHMPDFSQHAFSSAGERKFHLQLLLDIKEKQLQQAGTLGQRVLAQQIELEEKIRQIQELDAERGDDEELDAEARERYRELADTIKAWDVENAQLSSAFGAKHCPEDDLSQSLPVKDPQRDEPERSKTPASSAAQSRRAKNAAHRADDVEFAFEIGSGLLTEVRRLQSLLGERDKAIQDMKEEKDDLEKTVESLRTALRAQEQSSDKFKEENWNLEVTLQELRAQLSDSQSTAQRLESEHKRLTKLLNSARESSDQYKNEAERVKTTFDEFKAKHETEFAQARKYAAGLQRDKSDLQSALDAMKVEVTKAQRRLGPKFGSPFTPGTGDAKDFLTPVMADEDDVFTTAGASTNRRKMDTSAVFQPDNFEDLVDVSPDPSPSRPFQAANHPSKEIEDLQQRLQHAQRQIKKLTGSLHREKEMRMDYRRRLEASPGYVHDEDEPPEDDLFEADDDSADEKPKRKVTPFRGGRARGRRGRGGAGAFSRRLGAATSTPSSDYGGSFEPTLSPPPPVPSIPGQFQDGENGLDLEASEDEKEGERQPGGIQTSPSPLAPPSNRTSIDGMDPLYANVLRKSASYSSLLSSSSPLRQSVISRSARGGAPQRRSRGGAAFQEARPPSLVGQPEALSAALASEMGIGMSSVVEDDVMGSQKEVAEIACQTDFEDVTLAVPSAVPAPETSEASVQVESEATPVPTQFGAVSVVGMSDMSCQTDEAVAVDSVDMAIQHTSVEPKTDTQVVSQIQTQAQTSLTNMGAFPRAFSPASRRTTLTQSDFSPISPDRSGGDTTIRGVRIPGALSVTDDASESERDFNDTATETGMETETDADDYHDARMSIGRTTPSASREDFHSMLTMSDNDYSESDEDDESIKASRMPSRAGMDSVDSFTERHEFHRPLVEYDEKGVEAAFEEVKIVEVVKPVEVIKEVVKEVVKEVEVVKYIKQPKPEVQEMSIQTDEPAPATPPTSPIPIPVSTPVRQQDTSTSSATPTAHPAPTSPGGTSPIGLFRVGSAGGQLFHFVPTSSPLPSAPVSPPAPTGSLRDSTATFGAIRPASQSDRRQSIESAMEAIVDEAARRPRTMSAVPSIVDKTRPPMMVVPPPPRQPPPTNNMPPPTFIPERRFPTTSSASDVPPPRPSSPPPPELIQRATTPLGTMLSVHGRGSYGPRQHGSSLPPQSNIRQPPSTSSFRSAANAAAHAQNSQGPSGLPSWSVREPERRELSSTSLGSDRSALSPRSSMSSDHNVFMNRRPPPTVPSKIADQSDRGGATDPTVIHAITQTMIGEFLYKYTRRTLGKGHGEKRHKRFFWVHPYTKHLYWSSADPGSQNVSESSSKSAYIEGIRAVLDPNPMPPGLYQYSIIISTSQREMKVTAPTKERHEIWLNALKYLLSRPAPPTPNENAALSSPMSHNAELTEDDRQFVDSSPQSQRSGRSSRNGGAFSTTPRGKRSRSQLSVRGSVGKRTGTPAAEYLRWTAPESPYSPSRSFEQVMGNNQDDAELDFELHAESKSDEGFEGLENVRACCDGRHTVGHSGHPHHHHHHNAPHLHNGDHLEVNAPARPVSPAWSLRSRTGSAHSHDTGGLFSWGRGDDGKLRFGSRRSTRTVPNTTGDR